MKKKLVLGLMAGSLLFFASCADNQDDSVENAKEQNEEMHDDSALEKDSKFAVKAAAGGMFEVEAGRLAMSNGSSQEVKNFGQHMVDDHSIVNEELKNAATSKNIALPANMGEDLEEKMNKLREKTGADFDKEYISMMVKDHKDDIDLFEDESNGGNDADLKAWAGQKLPTLRNHLQMAETIEETLKK